MSVQTQERPATFTSAEVARLADVKVETVKKAEREGRIPQAPREVGGDDRVYTPELLAAVRDYFRR